MIIETKTNLHVGSGDMNFDIVDKRVQRDSISALPIINSSSFKGALRNHFDYVDEGSCMKVEDRLDFIFGAEEDSCGNGSQGYVKFLDSYLLFLPLRSDKRAFYHVTSKKNLQSFCSFYEELGYDMVCIKEQVNKLDDDTIFDYDEAYIEDELCLKSTENISVLEEIFGKINIAIFSDEKFNEAVNHLPIIARNKLKDGKSQNLWYEEIEQIKSIFYTTMLDYSSYGCRVLNKSNYTINCFYDELERGFVQIGSNASIGFGLCALKKLELPVNEER